MNTEEYFNKDLYKILNITKSATQNEIKMAYRKLMRIYHPDINETNESKKMFNEIRNAYDILSDEKKKKLYDIKNGINFEKKPEDEKTDILSEDAIVEKDEQKSFINTLSEIIEGIFVSQKNIDIESQKCEDISVM